MTFNLNQTVPLLFLGDAPDTPTGLGRIGHDLAWIASSMPEFRVAYLGRGATGRVRFPWTQYSYPVTGQWGEAYLETCWEDFAGDQRGVIMTVWDASRLLWFANGQGTGMEKFLDAGRFERWGYFMVDAVGVGGHSLPLAQVDVLNGYDRVLLASQWGQSICAGVTASDIDWLPHPINQAVWRPVDRLLARSGWAVGGKDTVIGCNMANQARKLWPVVMETIARSPRKPKLWMHTDVLMGHWNLPALIVEYGLEGRVICEGRPLSDRELAMRYSACDATVLISGGEGFSYPVAESLSCGVPCVTGSYSAQAELTAWVVDPMAMHVETQHNVVRAVYDAAGFVSALEALFESGPQQEKCLQLVAHLDMQKVGALWKRWFRKGAE